MIKKPKYYTIRFISFRQLLIVYYYHNGYLVKFEADYCVDHKYKDLAI